MLTRWVLPVVLTIGIVIVLLVLAPVLVAGLEVPSKPADFAPVVAEVLSGRLLPDRCGSVVLPREYSSLTKYGQAYAERKKNGQVLIFFPTWDLGRDGMRGYLFHNRPLSKADTLISYQGYWEVGIAVCTGVHYQRSHLPLWVDRKLSRHWYYVRTPGAPPGR